MVSGDDTAVILSALVGAACAVVVGYFAYAIAQQESVSFYYWVKYPVGRGGLWWGLGGAIVGGISAYIRQLERDN